MTSRLSPEAAIEAATEIVVAFLQNASISADELPELVRQVRAAVESDLEGVEATAARPSPRPAAPVAQPVPAVPIAESIHRDYIISLEDGAHYRSLRRHLMSKYGMTPDDYRAKWNLPPDYPMVAPSYAEARSEVARRTGLGHHPAKAPAARRSR